MPHQYLQQLGRPIQQADKDSRFSIRFLVTLPHRGRRQQIESIFKPGLAKMNMIVTDTFKNRFCLQGFISQYDAAYHPVESLNPVVSLRPGVGNHRVEGSGCETADSPQVLPPGHPALLAPSPGKSPEFICSFILICQTAKPWRKFYVQLVNVLLNSLLN